LSIYGTNENNEFSLNTNQIKLILNINKNIKILLVDDVILHLKILCLKIIKNIDANYKYDNFPVLTNDEWQSIGIIFIEYENYQFILAANGMYGKEIAFMIDCDIIISDIQMPLLNGIDMIYELINNNIKTNIIVNSGFIKNENEEIYKLLENKQISMFIEKGSQFDWNILNKL
jgi:CheY-like chemotaxis protein